MWITASSWCWSPPSVHGSLPAAPTPAILDEPVRTQLDELEEFVSGEIASAGEADAEDAPTPAADDQPAQPEGD
jgi:hypothetical protein